jgi:hypothetical protein
MIGLDQEAVVTQAVEAEEVAADIDPGIWVTMSRDEQLKVIADRKAKREAARSVTTANILLLLATPSVMTLLWALLLALPATAVTQPTLRGILSNAAARRAATATFPATQVNSTEIMDHNGRIWYNNGNADTYQ